MWELLHQYHNQLQTYRVKFKFLFSYFLHLDYIPQNIFGQGNVFKISFCVAVLSVGHIVGFICFSLCSNQSILSFLLFFFLIGMILPWLKSQNYIKSYIKVHSFLIPSTLFSFLSYTHCADNHFISFWFILPMVLFVNISVCMCVLFLIFLLFFYIKVYYMYSFALCFFFT